MEPVILVTLADEAASERMVEELQRYARDYRIVFRLIGTGGGRARPSAQTR
jgi:hypothetical protein